MVRFAPVFSAGEKPESDVCAEWEEHTPWDRTHLHSSGSAATMATEVPSVTRLCRRSIMTMPARGAVSIAVLQPSSL